MTSREGFLLLFLVAAALVAAFTFRLVVAPEDRHDPRHARRFAANAERLPALAAVRVRSPAPRAAHRLATAPVEGVRRVSSAARVDAVFRYGRLLFASTDAAEAVLAQLERGGVPELPPLPRLETYYRDGRGPYDCDVVVDGPAAVAGIRAVLPDAHLAGEPVARASENGYRPELLRALLAALAATGALVAWRRGARETERRVLAVLVTLAVLGLSRLGADAGTALALVVVLAARRGQPLLAALPCVFFPSLALRRLGVALVVGGLVRHGAGAKPAPRGGRRAAALVLAALAPLGAIALLFWPADESVPEPVRAEPAAFLHRDAATFAAGYRETGADVIGAGNPIPLPADLEKRRLLARIFREAKRRAAIAPADLRPRFEAVADAAAVDSLYLPPELRARVRRTDGVPVFWMLDPVPHDDTDFTSAKLYRLRGSIQLQRESRIAAWLVFAIVGGSLVFLRGDASFGPMGARFAGAAAALVVLGTAGADPVFAPLAVVATCVPAIGALPGLLAAALLHPSLAFPAAALALAMAFGRFGEPRTRELTTT